MFAVIIDAPSATTYFFLMTIALDIFFLLELQGRFLSTFQETPT